MKIGLMGGTFNPIHLGHLIMCEYIRDSFPLDKIIFIPSGNPPHKDSEDIISTDHRVNMVELAVKSNPFFEISLCEINRKGKSYTVDTIEEFRKLYPNEELFFIIGGDTLYNLTSWMKPERLFKITNFILIGRKGLDEEKNLAKIEELRDKYDANILYMDGPIIEISSTDIRNNIRKKRSIKYLVPEEVDLYIIDNKLYLTEV